MRNSFCLLYSEVVWCSPHLELKLSGMEGLTPEQSATHLRFAQTEAYCRQIRPVRLSPSQLLRPLSLLH